MGMYRRRRVVFVLMACLLLVGCAELGDFFEILAYEESEDPEVQRSAEVIARIREEREVEDSLQRFAETGELRHLEANAVQKSRGIRKHDRRDHAASR